MELYEALLLSMLAGTASTLLGVLLGALVHLFTYVIVVSDQAQVSALDRRLAEVGWCSSRTLGPSHLPADGAHFLFLRRPLVAIRRSEKATYGNKQETYTVYALGAHAVLALRGALVGNPRDVAVRYVYAPSCFRTSAITQRCTPPPCAYPWQERAVAELETAYTRSGRASMLVCGPTGVGKSSLGELLAVKLAALHRVAPEVVKNLDLSTKGLLLEDAYAAPAVSTPIILMLDEVDATIDSAESGVTARDKREGASLADTPTSLLGVFDRLNRTQHLVVIATTNKTTTVMRGGIYARYTRPGRFDAVVNAAQPPSSTETQ